MKSVIKLFAAGILMATAGSSLAAVHYVDVNSASPTPPYTNWATAAAIIQDAVDAAVAGDEIVVTNGIYVTGGRAVDGTMTNRVAVDKALTLRSVNGPEFTTIQGHQVPGSINGDDAIRCVFLGKGAFLSGFTLTNGATRTVFENAPNRESSGGGVWCEYRDSVMVSNCVIAGSSAAYYSAGVAQGTLHRCTLTGNLGAGASYSALNDCQVIGNLGDGADFSTLNNCTLVGNAGFGAGNCTLNNCTVTGNTNAGVNSCTLHNCTLTGNFGAGATSSTLANCALTGNSGSGASSSILNHCTLTGNSGGGAFGCALTNCIVYFNTADQGINYDGSSTLNYCCTTPQPPNGAGNISLDPQLARASHLSAGSPCRGAGNVAFSSGSDIDGEPWASPPSIGCDEYYPGVVTGPLNVAIAPSFTNALPGFTLEFKAAIEGQTTGNVWDFADGITVTNQPYTFHAWATPGDYPVVLRVFNDSQPGGVRATVTVHVLAEAVYYVAADNTKPVAPYTSWATAATNIQDAVDATSVVGGLVLVTDGIYATGGRNGNRVTVDKPLSIRSVHGPQFTTIDGGHSGRCVSLTRLTSLSGFTLTNGTASYGAGLWCESTNALVSNCVLSGNSGSGDQRGSGSAGGGAYGGTLNNCVLSKNRVLGSSQGQFFGSGAGAYNATLNNCTLSGNSAGSDGGGASGCILSNCTLTGNSAGSGGGVSGCTLNNCALIGNSATSGGGALTSTLNNCTLTGNSASSSGGGVSGGRQNTWNDWAIFDNSTGDGGGGAPGSVLNNCIVYFNSAPQGANYDAYCALNYCCTMPQPAGGVGNILSDPQLADSWHLSGASLCLGAGSDVYVSGTDLDGEPWAKPPAIGCDEYRADPRTGALSVAVTASRTNVVIGFTVQLTGSIQGEAAANSWDFGDGLTATNEPYATHAWAAAGDYVVALRAYNDNQPGGTSTNVIIHVMDGIHYVAINSANPVAPYTSWNTAARSIQAAINAAIEPGSLVLVTNGTYAPVTLHSLLSVRSVNGAALTIIDGRSATRCASLASDASLSGFTLTNGVSEFGGGASGGTLNNCTFSGNSARNDSGNGGYGGGAYECTLNNCMLNDNSAARGGGGASGCALNNCTLTGNTAGVNAGGAYACKLNNCIAYFNTASAEPNYDSSSTLNYSCTTPQPTNGPGNISADPQLADLSHLSSLSPCRGVGNLAYASGVDIDGESWDGPPSMGCDEYHAGAITGSLRLAVEGAFKEVVAGLAVPFKALIVGRATANVWAFGDGVRVTNQLYTSHAWAMPGDYPVILTAYNESQPGGISATVTVHVVAQPVHYVAADSSNPVAPYKSWATAAASIQDAVDAATVRGALVLVTNGSYATGGRLSEGTVNRVFADKFLTVRSVNGARFTVIDGGSSTRCAYLANSATLSGFTLTNGVSRDRGGGVRCAAITEVVSNCVLVGNSIHGPSSGDNPPPADGGGAYGGTLNDCTIIGNSAYDGGGASACTLNNSTLTGNSAAAFGSGGGVAGCTLNNCTLTGNSGYYGGGAYSCTLNNCQLTGNAAGREGGGANNGTLNNCTLMGNVAESGGGVSEGTLNNCTLTGNSAVRGGGAYTSTLNNCVSYFNTATFETNYSSSTLRFCCTTPDPGSIGNTTNAPLFLDLPGGDVRLQSGSPCINAGLNPFAPAASDLDGNSRIVGGTVDIGAYEFQAPTSTISYAWLQDFGLPTDGSADTSDPDGDGLNNWQEWRCGTNPNDPLSGLRLLAPVTGGSAVTVTWQSVAGVSYFLERGAHLEESPAFRPLVSNLAGQPGTTSYTDTNAVGSGPWFYRVGVGP